MKAFFLSFPCVSFAFQLLARNSRPGCIGIRQRKARRTAIAWRVAGAVKRDHNGPMSLSPFSSPRAAPEPLTFREARDRLLELEDDYHGARAAFSGRARASSTGRSNGSTPSLPRESMARRSPSKSSASGSRRGPSPNSPGIVASRQRPALARRQARRSPVDDAGRRSRTLGDDAGGDEARPRADPGDADAGPSRHRRPARAGPGEISGRAWGRCGEIRWACRRRRAHRGRRGAARLAALRHASGQPVLHPRRPDQSRRPDAALFHLGHDGALEARGAYACELSDRASLDMYGLGPESPATRISTFPRPAGPSTPGRASSRPGTRARPSWRSAMRFEPRAALDALVEHQVTVSARPRPCGGC